MDKLQIQDRLERAIRDAVEQAGVRLGHGNEYALPAMAAHAAEEISKLPSDFDQRVMVLQGISAYESLVAEMVRAATVLENYPPGVIGEDTLALARAARGPFPPWW